MSGSAFDQKTLWATDGTEAGTEQLSTTVFQSWVFNTEFDGKFYFGGLPWNSTDWGLYVTDGTTQGTGKVATDIPAPDIRSPMGFVEVDNELIFTWGDRFLSLMKREDPETLVPVVQIARSASGTIEGVDRPVEFAISRIGSTDEPLRVTYSVGGTARAGSDYEVLPGTSQSLADRLPSTFPSSWWTTKCLNRGRTTHSFGKLWRLRVGGSIVCGIRDPG